MNSQHYIFVTGSVARPDEPVKTTWVTPDVIKKNQVKTGFEDIQCTVGGQKVADWGDEFMVGIR